jgi:hypothetical protein
MCISISISTIHVSNCFDNSLERYKGSDTIIILPLSLSHCPSFYSCPSLLSKNERSSGFENIKKYVRLNKVSYVHT